MKFSFKNIVQGMASIGEGLASFNLFPSAPERSTQKPLSAEEVSRQTREALQQDWENVGQDLRAAMDQIDKELRAQGIEPPQRNS